MALGKEDEWDEKIKQSLRYTVWLLIKHPSMDPAMITETLQLKPNLAGIAGSRRMTPAGKPLLSKYKESTWSHWFRTERGRLFFNDVVNVIDKLEPHKAFLNDIVNEGGTISLIVHLPGDINIGDTFRWREMARLSALRISLGIEVFPEFN